MSKIIDVIIIDVIIYDMTNDLAHKYLQRIKNISAALFFIHLLTILIIIFYPIALSTWWPAIPLTGSTVNQLYGYQVASIVFLLLFVLFGSASLGLEIANILYCCLVRVNNETVPVLIVFSALSLLLVGIAPLVLWILAIKYRDKIENSESEKLLKAKKENSNNANQI